jgi:hypothetical protein
LRGKKDVNKEEALKNYLHGHDDNHIVLLDFAFGDCVFIFHNFTYWRDREIQEEEMSQGREGEKKREGKRGRYLRKRLSWHRPHPNSISFRYFS